VAAQQGCEIHVYTPDSATPRKAASSAASCAYVGRSVPRAKRSASSRVPRTARWPIYCRCKSAASPVARRPWTSPKASELSAKGASPRLPTD